MTQQLKTLPAAVLKKVQEEYAHLAQTTSFSLQSLFNYQQFTLEDYCRTYHPHPQSAKLISLVQQFSEQHGIWRSDAQHYVTCALFLYPTASFHHMLAMVQNCAIDYFLNDTMGREIFPQLSPAAQQEARTIIDRMGRVSERLEVPPNAAPVELANYEMLRAIKNTSPENWFREFVKHYSYHLAVTHRDNNAAALHYIPSVDEYIEMRNHTSGMPHIVLLIEYSEEAFLDWEALGRLGIAPLLRKTQRAAALIGSLMNDLFSFEKEVINNNTDANLLMSIALNHPAFSLTEVIHYGAAIVQEQLLEFMSGMEALRHHCRLHLASEPAVINDLQLHMGGLQRCVQASWMWQVHTRRYKQSFSIWEETQLAAKAMV
jgi:hypothetical protein